MDAKYDKILFHPIGSLYSYNQKSLQNASDIERVGEWLLTMTTKELKIYRQFNDLKKYIWIFPGNDLPLIASFLYFQPHITISSSLSIDWLNFGT